MKNSVITTPLVSVEWLFEHLDSDNLVILDASIKKVVGSSDDENKVQIPGSRFFDLKSAFSNTSAPFPSTFPCEEQFTLEARKLGINSDSAIVVYDDKGIYSSARAWWMFKAMGHDNVAVLNGGLPEWLNAGYAKETKTNPKVSEGDFVATLQDGYMKFFDDVKQASKTQSHTIMDARSEGRFNGAEQEPQTSTLYSIKKSRGFRLRCFC